MKEKVIPDVNRYALLLRPVTCENAVKTFATLTNKSESTALAWSAAHRRAACSCLVSRVRLN